MVRFFGGKVYGFKSPKKPVQQKPVQQQTLKQQKPVQKQQTLKQQQQQVVVKQQKPKVAPKQVQVVKATTYQKVAPSGTLIQLWKKWKKWEQHSKKNVKLDLAIKKLLEDLNTIATAKYTRQDIPKIYAQLINIDNESTRIGQLKALDNYAALKQRVIKGEMDRLKILRVKKLINRFKKFENEALKMAQAQDQAE